MNSMAKKKRKNKGCLYSIIIGVVVIIIVWAGFRFGGNRDIRVSTGFPGKRNIVETITANGKVQPETEVKISPDVSGEIVELNVREGDEVKKGDILLKIDPDVYRSNLERARASLNTSKANREQAKAQLIDKENTYRRIKKLYEQNAVSESEYESAGSAWKIAEANYKAAGYNVSSAEAMVKEAKENYLKTTISAPMSGTISRLNVEKGERVVGTMQMAGTELLRIADLNKMEIMVEVNENDIVRVSLGDTALIDIDAYMGHPFRGVVSEIANSAITTGIAADQVTSFEVKIHILQESYQSLKNERNTYPLRPGMSAAVDIQTEKAENVLAVPIQAVTTREPEIEKEQDSLSATGAAFFPEPTGTDEVVFIFKNGKVKKQSVETGVQDMNYIRIISGLKGSEEIVVAPYNTISKELKDGQEVNKVKKNELYRMPER